MNPIFKISPLLFLLIFTVSCEDTLKGDFNENQTPSTFLTIEKIDREGDFRLSSQINISWWGNDTDGYIIGYEYAINDTLEGDWTFTRRSDSTFILPISEGNVEDDVLFKIRAVDNDSARDPVGARLVFPIVNSAPSVSINTTETPPDTLWSIASFGWTVSDPDGLGNIIRTEIAVNDTTGDWLEIPIPEGEDRVFINLEIDNTTTGTKTADVFLGRSYQTAPELQVPGLEVNADNTFYVRVVDAAGAVSTVDEISWFIKQRTSNTLFLNDYSGSNSLDKADFHLQLLDQNGINPDVWIINDGEVALGQVELSEAFPTVKDPTLVKTLSDWDHIYWLSNDLRRNVVFAQEILSEFYDNGGTSFFNIPLSNIGQEHPVFNLIPIDSIGAGSYLILEDEEAFPVTNEIPQELTLQVESGGFALSNVFPFKSINSAESLYDVNFYRRSANGGLREYDGYQTIAVENPEGNLIYFSLELPNVRGNNNLDQFINELLIGRLNFKQ